ncbi:hypothetical protein [Coleofasciculus sp. FACHB-SPT36]|uniref:hypothetical protein n=1 Tax=Cyanophyceae TaxID=3028117 RepID=UPI0018EF7DF9|nr:hypothetical protein [Coleofasciculus sp. FACHB-SPT36]
MIPDLPLIGLDAPPPLVSLPANFPDSAQIPRFLYGDRVRWKPVSDIDKTDKGSVIGRFYAFAPHQNQWAWKYLIFLDPVSYSAAFCTADTAWEEDLEPIDGDESL